MLDGQLNLYCLQLSRAAIPYMLLKEQVWLQIWIPRALISLLDIFISEQFYWIWRSTNKCK